MAQIIRNLPDSITFFNITLARTTKNKLQFSVDSIISTALLLGSIQGLILAVFIFLKKKNYLANKYLAISIAFLSFSLLANFGELNEWHLSYPHLIGVQNVFIFVFMPMLYFYVLLTTQKVKELSKIHLLHLLPLVLYLLLEMPFLLQPAAIKLLQSGTSTDSIGSILKESILNLYPLVYSILMLACVLQYSNRIKSLYAEFGKATLRWLKTLIYSLHSAIVASIVVLFLKILITDLPTFISFITAIIIVVLIYLIGYFALQQPKIFNLELWKFEKKQKQQEKSQDTPISILDDYLRKLLLFMDQEKPFTNPDLTIKDLAEKLSIPVYILSKIINEKLSQNYFSFINQYRIDHIKEELKKDDNAAEQIMILAYNSGFKSKSTFNSYFKKHTGLSPTQFRKEALSKI